MRIEDPVSTILQQLDAPDAPVLDLLQEYEGDAYEALWKQDARLYHAFGKKLISDGYPTRAFELIREGLTPHENDLDLQYLRALALARGGSIAKAGEYIDELLGKCGGHPPLQVEVLSLAGSLKKRNYVRATTNQTDLKADDLAKASASYYEAAYKLSGDSFPGINAATMYLLVGQKKKAHRLAKHSAARAESALTTLAKPDDHWRYATLGEAALILGDQRKAADWYRQAVAHAPGRGDIASMYRNVLLLQRVVALSPALLALFNLGSVVVFSGHMIDHPERQIPRFPPDPALEHAVSEAIQRQLDRLNATVGYCSAASGSDMLFAEQMLQRMLHNHHGELHIVLPFEKNDFYTTSVDFGRPERSVWRERCDRILAHKDVQVHYATTEKFLGDDVLFDFANTVAQGLALTHAAQLGVEPYALVVHDPSLQQEPVGGTAYFLRAWKGGRRKARVINLATMRSKVRIKAHETAEHTRPSAPIVTEETIKRQVKAMIFADVKNFSKLNEEQTPLFITKFLNGVAELIEPLKKRNKIAFCNTWGDGLYLVFHKVVDCADCAIKLLDWIGKADLADMGLPLDTTIRMGIHCGPVYPGMDKIIRRKNFFGSHVNRAARIEPVTMPGAAFTSEQFAAVLAVESRGTFVCEYVGVTGLAKGYDRSPLYRLEHQ